MTDEEYAELPRRVLAEVDALIEAHMADKQKAHNNGMDWALNVQRATRCYLYQLGAPEAPSWWGKWKERRLPGRWGDTKP